MRLPGFRAIIDKAAATFSGDRRAFEAAKASALQATIEGKLEEALALWEALRERWPREPAGYCGAVACNRTLQRFDRATELVDLALKRFPDDTSVIAEAAQLAQARFDWPRAAELWDKIVRRRDAGVIYLQIYAFALFVLGRDDRLEEATRLMRKRFPASPARIAIEAMLATRREDWDRALTLWREHMRLHPDNAAGWEHYGLAYQGRQLALLDENGGEREIEAVNPAQITVIENEEARALLLRFESIGSNCEFGLLQRRFGAEPLGLLRFNQVEIGGLIEALAHRFDDMGAPEHTELMTLQNGEYFIRDRRFGLAMHTFLYKWNEDGEQLLAKFRRRVAFLKDKMLDDLAEARKIFVFSSATLRLDELLMLHAALSRFGDVTLLHVRPIGARAAGFEKAAAGEVIEIRPRLFVGFSSRPGFNARGDWDIPFDDWLGICRATLAMRERSSPIVVADA
jgi:hypothetical protein